MSPWHSSLLTTFSSIAPRVPRIPRLANYLLPIPHKSYSAGAWRKKRKKRTPPTATTSCGDYTPPESLTQFFANHVQQHRPTGPRFPRLARITCFRPKSYRLELGKKERKKRRYTPPRVPAQFLATSVASPHGSGARDCQELPASDCWYTHNRAGWGYSH